VTDEDTTEAAGSPLQAKSAAREPVSARQTPAELYELRLKNIWRTVHQQPLDLDTATGADGWQLILDAAKLAGLMPGTAEPALGPQWDADPSRNEAFAGRARDVDLIVAATVEEMSSQAVDERSAQLVFERFIRGKLANTVARLETQGASREEITDIVVRALRPLRNMPPVVDLARVLFLYVYSDEHAVRNEGYFLTIAVIGDVLNAADNQTHDPAAAIAYHAAVRGVWGLVAAAGGMTATARRFVRLNAYDLAYQINRLPTASEQARHRVLKAILEICAVTAPPPASPVDQGVALRALETMGLSGEGAEDTLVVINNLSSLAEAVEPDTLAAARIEAMGAVAAAVLDEPRRIAQRFFNSGISVGRVTARRGEEAFTRARLLLNLLGVQWSVLLSAAAPQPIEQDGIDCAANFLGVANTYLQDFGRTPLWTGMLPATRAVLNLAYAYGGADPILRRSRLQQMADDFGVAFAEPGPAEGLLTDLSASVAVLAGSAGSAGTVDFHSSTEMVIATGRTVRWIFVELLGQAHWETEPNIKRLSIARNAPGDFFVENFAEFAEPSDSVLGAGPLVPAQVMDARTWALEAERIRRGPASIVQAMRVFSLGSLN
jgi:hypothetical protein